MMRSCHEWGDGGRRTRAQFIGAISETKMHIDTDDGLKVAAAAAAELYYPGKLCRHSLRSCAVRHARREQFTIHPIG